ncbi:hypothetical protein Q8F55_001473 [Vanrija albida]|uniref:Uncharacterized protein n=1 Tax=Vanrija albida TaxID=181172 RepID=A0ABR3QG45_9TREE
MATTALMSLFDRHSPSADHVPVFFEFTSWETPKVYAIVPKFGNGERSLACVQGQHEFFQEFLPKLQVRVDSWTTAIKEGSGSGEPIPGVVDSNGRLQYILDLVCEFADIYRRAHSLDELVAQKENSNHYDKALTCTRAASFTALDDLFLELDKELQTLYPRVKRLRGGAFRNLTLNVQEAMNELAFAWEAFEVLHEEVVRCVD